jgi:hypothetical protein
MLAGSEALFQAERAQDSQISLARKKPRELTMPQHIADWPGYTPGVVSVVFGKSSE